MARNNYTTETQFINDFNCVGGFRFEHIVFNSHPIVDGGVQAIVEFHNGEYCSIIGGGDGLYGDGVNSFEIQSSITIKTRAGVRGWLTKTQVMRHLKYLQKKEKENAK